MKTLSNLTPMLAGLIVVAELIGIGVLIQTGMLDAEYGKMAAGFVLGGTTTAVTIGAASKGPGV